MRCSVWNEYSFEDKILKVLKEHADKHTEHPLGTPFLTSYQIAIFLKVEFEDELRELAVDGIGGKGHGKKTSFAQYIARMLSRWSKKEGTPVEGAFLSQANVLEASYKYDDGTTIVSSIRGRGALSMFRCTKEFLRLNNVSTAGGTAL